MPLTGRCCRNKALNFLLRHVVFYFEVCHIKIFVISSPGIYFYLMVCDIISWYMIISHGM